MWGCCVLEFFLFRGFDGEFLLFELFGFGSFHAEVGSYVDALHGDEGGHTAQHYPPEEVDVAGRAVAAEDVHGVERVVNPSGRHPGNHHSQSHEGGAESVVRRLVFTL